MKSLATGQTDYLNYKKTIIKKHSEANEKHHWHLIKCVLICESLVTDT